MGCEKKAEGSAASALRTKSEQGRVMAKVMKSITRFASLAISWRQRRSGCVPGIGGKQNHQRAVPRQGGALDQGRSSGQGHERQTGTAMQAFKNTLSDAEIAANRDL